MTSKTATPNVIGMGIRASLGVGLVVMASCATHPVEQNNRRGLQEGAPSGPQASFPVKRPGSSDAGAPANAQPPAQDGHAASASPEGRAQPSAKAKAPVWAPSYTTASVGPAHNPELLALRAEAQARILGRGSELESATGDTLPPPSKSKSGSRANGNALGQFVPIENEAALRSFHLALHRLEKGELPGGKLRILAYGASHTQADIYPGYLRYYLQSRFGDGGPGFVQVAKINKWYRPLDVSVSSHGFDIQHAQQNASRASGWFGLLGAAAVGKSSAARATIRPRKGRRGAEGPLQLELFAMGQAKGGELSLQVDGSSHASWSTRADPARFLLFSSELPAGWSEVTARPAGNGPVRLFGAALERATPGIVVDTLGISGTRAANMLRWEEDVWAEQVKRRQPYLVTLAYGTNESSDEGQPIERYERDLAEVLARLKRAAPQASCVLMGPGDSDKKKGGAWVPRPRLTPIIEVQRRQAFEHGCGFWDARRFMGKGGVERWVRAIPPMASGDRIHLTQRGYTKIGLVFGDALLRAYDAAKQPRSE